MSEPVKVPWHVAFAPVCATPTKPGLVIPCEDCGCDCGGYRRVPPELCWKCAAERIKATQPEQTALGL